MLKDVFHKLVSKYTADDNLISQMWLEIESSYSGEGRHYHTLQHLENLLLQLQDVKSRLQDWDTIRFTLFYHDLIYNALKADNEEASAYLAEKRLRQMGVPFDKIQLCKEQIIATKSHAISTNADTNYFTDADLSILGKPWDTFYRYSSDVRKEYAAYPDEVYKLGRQKVLQHLLAMARIFKTDFFYNKFESQARQNLQMEMKMLA